MPLAPFYDVGTRNFNTTSGMVQAMHPVDHEVDWRVGVLSGAVRSAPDGLDLEPVRQAPPSRRAAVLEAQVRARLASMVSAGKIRILAVRLVNALSAPAWRIEWELVYVNLRLTSASPIRRKYAAR
jgi:hypothetical protein